MAGGGGGMLGNSMIQMGQRLGGVLPNTKTAGYTSVTPNVYTPPAAQQGVGLSPFAQQMAMRSMTQQPVLGLPSALLQRQQDMRNPINALYQNILGRAPDAEGAKYWQSQLDSGVPLNQIQQSFLNSQEYKARPITALYQNILGRAPDAEGAQYWQNQLNSGMPLSEIQQAFLNSQEYKAKAPTQQPQMQMPMYRSPALNYRPNMQQAQQNLRRVKPSVYKSDLDAARQRIAELEAAQQPNYYGE